LDQSGYVSWEEFSSWFNTNSKRKKVIGDKEEWDVSDSDGDSLLNRAEFQCFRHPGIIKFD
jgi:hypothetical protein